MIRKIFLIINASILIFSLSACYDYKSFNEYLIAAGLGIDFIDNNYLVTAEVMEMGDKTNSMNSAILSGSSDTIQGAINKINNNSPGRLLLTHCQIIIIGEELAEKGIEKIIDYIIKGSEINMKTDMLIAKDAHAFDIFKEKIENVNVISTEIFNILKSKQNYKKKPYNFSIIEVNNNMEDNIKGSVLPLIYISEKQYLTGGFAIFSQNKLAGYCSEDEGVILSFINNLIKEEIFGIKNEYGYTSAVEILKSENKITPVINNRKIKINMNVNIKSKYIETTENYQSDQDKFSEKLSRDIYSFIYKAQQEYKTDIFGFSKEIEKKYRKEWQAIKQDWQNIFINIEPVVEVKFIIDKG